MMHAAPCFLLPAWLCLSLQGLCVLQLLMAGSLMLLKQVLTC
jgi:hypothetical protein